MYLCTNKEFYSCAKLCKPYVVFVETIKLSYSLQTYILVTYSFVHVVCVFVCVCEIREKGDTLWWKVGLTSLAVDKLSVSYCLLLTCI